MDTYNNAVNDGLLKREWSKTESDVIYTLTDKGKELVNSENFKKQLEKTSRIHCTTKTLKIQPW